MVQAINMVSVQQQILFAGNLLFATELLLLLLPFHGFVVSRLRSFCRFQKGELGCIWEVGNLRDHFQAVFLKQKLNGHVHFQLVRAYPLPDFVRAFSSGLLSDILICDLFDHLKCPDCPRAVNKGSLIHRQ